MASNDQAQQNVQRAVEEARKRRPPGAATSAAAMREFAEFSDDFPNHSPVLLEVYKADTMGVLLGTEACGLIIKNVVEGSVAHEAGLRMGDVVLKIDDATVRHFSQAVVGKRLQEVPKGSVRA